MFKNFTIDEEENCVIVSVNPKIYPLEVVYAAAYMFLENFYVIIDGNPQEEIFVQLKAKRDGEDLKKVALEFNNELINYAVYTVQAARTSTIRNAIVQRALGTVTEATSPSPEVLINKESEEGEEVEYVEDPLGIAQPWTPEKMRGLKIPEEFKEVFKEISKKEKT